MIRLRDLIKEFSVSKGDFTRFRGSWILSLGMKDGNTNKMVKSHEDIVSKLWAEDRKNGGYKKREIDDLSVKKLIDGYVKSVLSGGTNHSTVGGDIHMTFYFRDNDVTIGLFDFGVLYDNPYKYFSPKDFRFRSDDSFISSHYESERNIMDEVVVGWIRGRGGKGQFGINPKIVFSLDNVLKIDGIFVNQKRRGEGYGKLLYDTIMKYSDALVSDSQLYEGSFGLWTKYIHDKSKFFGVMYRTERYSFVFPIPPGAKLTPSFFGNSGDLETPAGFVSISKKVPSSVTSFSKKIMSLGVGDLDVFDASNSKFTKAVESVLDDSISIDEVMEEFGSSELGLKFVYKNVKTPKVLFCFADALVLVKEVGDGLDWELL